MSASGRLWRRHRAALVVNLALVVALTGVVTYAVSAEGFKTHRAELNDGGIWVTSDRYYSFGRINKPIGQFDGMMFAPDEASLDIVQDGAAVAGLDLSGRTVAAIDPATVSDPDSEPARLPREAQVQLAGGTLAVLDPATGSLRATRVDPETGMPRVSDVGTTAPPTVRAGAASDLVVTQGGTVLVVSAAEDTLVRLVPTADGFAEPVAESLPEPVADAVSVTSVGEVPILSDLTTGALQAVGGVRAVVPPGTVLQQAGPASSAVVVATPTSLATLDLATGALVTVAEGLDGRPAEPVRLGDCLYGAWSGGHGAVVTRCGDGEPVVAYLRGDTSDLVFRVNRGEVLLNDRLSGAVWNLESETPTRIDDWEAFSHSKDDESQRPDTAESRNGDRSPPRAKDDQFGARPGRITVLHPLDNDSAPEGRLLAIRSVDKVTGPSGDVRISPDGQTIQLHLPADAKGTTSFEYYVDDGRQDVAAHATVEVATRGESANQLPELRRGYKPHVWSVPAGGELDLPVLPDWRDKRDGDQLSVVSATVDRASAGAVAQVTTAGRLHVTAPVSAGQLKVDYAVSDGRGESVPASFNVRVQEPGKDEPVAPVAEPDVVSVEVGRWVTIRPLANDLPGSDPFQPEATLELSGKVVPVGSTQVRTDLAAGTLTFRSAVAKTYVLGYDVAYGDAPVAHGKIRVDVQPRQRDRPLAVPDTTTLFGPAATLVDVLANDLDPAGGMLVVQEARAIDPSQVDVAVVDGRWLRVGAREGILRVSPQVVRYTISNGNRSAEGELTLTQQTAPEDSSPVTQADEVTVRAGGSASIPVLDNDFSPAGDSLSLVSDASGGQSGQLTVRAPGDERVPTGQAFVAGRLVRYVAPPQVRAGDTFTVDYVASNSAGDTAPGRVSITVVANDGSNRPPEPPVLEGRSVSGGTVTLKLPGSGIDPDGDNVTVLGLASAPRLGRVVTIGASSIAYQSYPGSTGTEEFEYLVTDALGEQATGTVRVAIVPPGSPARPLAVADSITLEPSRTAVVDVLGNDFIAPGERAALELVDPPAGVSLASPTGPMLVGAPGRTGRVVEVGYRLSNGLDSSQSTLTLRTARPYNNPPVVFDAFGRVSDSETVRINVLRTAYDPDGDVSDLRVASIFPPDGVQASVRQGRIIVARGDEPVVVPFRVEDADGGAALAQVYVPATGSGLPYVKPGALVRVDPGETVDEQLADYVVNPSGGPVRFSPGVGAAGAPLGQVNAAITGSATFNVTADRRYGGPGAATFEVINKVSAGSQGVESVFLSVPVQVGAPTPILRCPDEPVPVPQGETVELDPSSLCNVFTADPERADSVQFAATWQRSVDGLTLERDTGNPLVVSAGPSARAGSEAILSVTGDGGEPAELRLRVTDADSPTLAPITVAGLRAGESTTLDLQRYLTPGVARPRPSLLRVSKIAGSGVSASPTGGTSVRLSASAEASGTAQFRVVMTDVGSGTDPARQAANVMTVELIGVPAAPGAPLPSTTPRNGAVRLSWRAPDAHGSPIDSYELRSSAGAVQRCPTTSCDFPGLSNGRTYTFTVRAHNAIGWSPYSPASRSARPDAVPGPVGTIRVLKKGDRVLRIGWAPPSTPTSKVTQYRVVGAGQSRLTSTPDLTVSGLDNNKTYRFTVYARNAQGWGEGRQSPEFQSSGPPGVPQAPTVRPDADAGTNTANVTMTWPAVDPNGPSQVYYTPLVDGVQVDHCASTTQRTCYVTGIPYDGLRHQFAVIAVVGRYRSRPGPSTPWTAVASPLPWRDWSLSATGNDAEAKATFTVPDSRGTTSKVTIFVDGLAVENYQPLRGQQTKTFAVPDNHGPHQVRLEVCSETPPCQPSTARQVQTYGPLQRSHIRTITAEVDGTRVRWVIDVDPNGANAGLRVTSDQRPTESFSVPGPNTRLVPTQWVDLGFDTTETITVELFDPGRGSVTKSMSATTDPPPPAKVTVSRARKCNDSPGSSLPGCNSDGTGVDCVDSSCGFLALTTANFFSAVRCTVRLGGAPPVDIDVGPIPDGATTALDLYYGNVGGNVRADCQSSDGTRTDTHLFDWPA